MFKSKLFTRTISIALVIISVLSLFSICSFAASPIKLTASNCTYTKTYNYTGKEIKPGVTVKYKSTTLKNKTDYTLSYSNNKKIGEGTITVTGKGKYTGKVNLKFNIVMGVPTNLKASSITYKNAKLSWSKVTGATKYYVYRYDNTAKKYVKAYEVTTNSATVSVESMKTTKYCVKAIGPKAGVASASIKIVGKLATPSLTATLENNDTVNFSWKTIYKAEGYRLYSYDRASDTYTILKTFNSPKTLSYKITGLKKSTGYEYALIAFYLDANGNKVFSAKTPVKTIVTAPDSVEGLKKSTITSSTAKISWTKMSDVTGYEVYKYDTAQKKYISVGKTTSTSFTVTGLKQLTKYDLGVKAYKTLNGVTTKSATLKKISITTIERDDLKEFQDIIKAKKFSIVFGIKGADDDGEEMNITSTISVSGQVAVNKAIANYSGLEMEMTNYYSEKDKKGYVIIDMEDEAMKVLALLAGMKLPAYQEVDAATAVSKGMDANSYVKMFAPDIMPGRTVTKSTGSVEGSSKVYTTYSYIASNGTFMVYYFDNNGKLVYLKSNGETVKISSFTSDVKSSSVSLPSNFPKGYAKRKDLV